MTGTSCGFLMVSGCSQEGTGENHENPIQIASLSA